MFVVLDIGDAQQDYPLRALAVTDSSWDARRVFLEACRVAYAQGYGELMRSPALGYSEATLPWRYSYSQRDSLGGLQHHRIEVHEVPYFPPEL